MVGPWDNWTIGQFWTMLCTPSQQTQESWHKTILKDKITDCFRGSTEHCFTIALPQLIQLDGILMPDTLCLHVPAVPTGMYEKAKKYINKQPSHIRICKTDRMTSAGKPEFFFYVLSLSSKFTSLSDKLIGQYESIAAGATCSLVCYVQYIYTCLTSLCILQATCPKESTSWSHCLTSCSQFTWCMNQNSWVSCIPVYSYVTHAYSYCIHMYLYCICMYSTRAQHVCISYG